MIKSVKIQVQRFKNNLKFWIKYLTPISLIVLFLTLGWYATISIKKLFDYIELIFNVLKTDQQKSDILHIWKLIFQTNLKIMIFDFLIIIGAAFIGWMFYQGFQIVSEFLYLKINKEEKVYQALREKHLLDLYKKATPWLLIFGIVILILVAIILIQRLKYYSDISSLLEFFWNTMLIIIPFVYIFVWYLYYKILFKKTNPDEFKYFFYSKPALTRRLQSFLNAFISLFLIMQMFFLAISFIETFEQKQYKLIESNKIYKRFWESNESEKAEYARIINVHPPEKLYDKIAITSGFYKKKELTKDVLTTIYNIMILAFAFEVLFPYLTIFLVFKLKRKEIKKLLINISIPIVITIAYQLITESIYFGIQLENILNYKTFSVYIFTLLITLIKQDNIFEFDTSTFANKV